MQAPKINVLYLDDELSNVIGFKASFRSLFNITGVTDAKAALDALTNNEFHAIVADQRMPVMTGIDFFESIIEKYPTPVRILMTGYADIKDTIDAINRGQIFRYISKPWREEELTAAVNNAYEMYNQRKEILQKNAELQKAYDELNRFVYSASHDMRAPLMSVLGIIKVARLDNPDENFREYLDMIETSINQLNVFNTNLIDYYTNSKDVHLAEPVDFSVMLDEIIATYKYYPQAEKINFIKHVQQVENFKIDSFRLRIVLNNLITNAIKFHDTKQAECYIKIDVQCSADHVLITVADNGNGIEEEHLSLIFDMFYRATRKNSGSGIGLYIVKEAIEKMHGTIDVKSTEGEGTTFIINIPNK